MNGEDTASVAPSQLGNYRLERPLGRGGMGTVFLAYDTHLHRRVALKMLDDAGSAGDSAARLLREARTVAALNHPNICTIHEVGSAGDSSFIAMEFVEGRTVRDHLDSGGVEIATALAVGIQAADALAYAHANNVVHRDFKAANVILTGHGRVKIVDFGLARRDDARESTMVSAVAPGTRAGTPYAMAPEQVRGDRADARTDIWGLGVLLYEMAAGCRPFGAPTVPELFSSILRDPPRPLPPTVPDALRSIIDRCLEKDPARRYQSASEVRELLERVPAARPSAAIWARRLWPVAAALALAGLVVILPRDEVTVGDPSPPATAAVAGPVRLAVLPFNNLTGDPDQEYFADGLTDETITQLGRLHPQRLSVIGRTSSMRYKNASASIDQIGRDLGVDFILEGSARREGNRVRVNARLLRARDQTQLWTDAFDRELASLLTLQNDVARGVAMALALTLLPEERRRLSDAPQVNSDAYEAYLRGRGHLGKLSRSDLDRALEYFELALQKDPNFALAHVGVAQVWSSRQQMQFTTPADAAPRMKAALQKAIDLGGDDLPDVQFARAGQLAWTDWNWAAAGPAFERALALRPNHAEARAFYSQYLMLMKRPDAAMAEIERALALDPLNDLVQALAGTVFTWAGRYPEAVALFQKALQTAPRNPVALNGLARALHHMGRFDESLEVDRRLWASRGDEETVRALTGPGEYRELMRRAADIQAARAGKTGTAPFYIAIMYVRAGAQDAALDWLERSAAAHDPNVPFVDSGPNWASLRNHPRYIAVRQKLGLP